jgi:tetratricopeptide (TPR) repeat protein
MRLSAACFLLALSLAATGCGPGRGRYGTPVHHAERGTVAGNEVSEDAFALALRDLLASDPGSRERQLRLQGVVSRQMTRVSTRYKTKNREKAVSSLSGAMYLVRAGELTNEMLGPSGYDALRNASDDFAKKGDEGRARATYEMLSRVAPAAEKSDIKGHLEAISAWTRDTGGGGVMQQAGALESAAVTRHLLEPSVEARDDAVARTVDFIEKALAVRNARKRGSQISREEGLEAVRALETGTTVLAAIHLRNADAQGALGALDKANVRELARVELIRALESVVERPEAEKWLDIARLLRPAPQRGHPGDEEDFGRDSELLRVASFTAACEAYRLDATSPEAAAFVATTLVELGMGEAAPAVLADAVKAQRDPRIVGLGLAVTMQAMGRALEAEEPDTVRRTYRAAQPILWAAEGMKNGKIQPSPAHVMAMMGEIELREGHLAEARKLLTDSSERERSGPVFLNLARLDWHEGKQKEALDRLKAALSAEDVAKDPAARAEILLLTSDITREGGDASGARKPLADALRDLAKARTAAEAEERARVERLISRVLDRFGAAPSAAKALERALEAAPRDKRQAAATIGQMIGRAFVRGDLAGARDGLSRALGADLGREDIVYYALWVRLLERQMHTPPSNGNGPSDAERTLAEAANDPRWIGRVAAFGAGKIKAEQLVTAAETPTQKTEALFYAAMDKRASGDVKGSDETLRQVVSSPGLDLIEHGLARELLAGAKANLGGPVPEVGLP